MRDGFGSAFIVGSGRCGSTLLSNILRDHPNILSLSEFFMEMASHAFAYRTLGGRAFWRLLSRPRLSVQKSINPRQCPNEFLYKFSTESSFTESTLPPILYVTLPHLTNDADAVYYELEPIICARPKASLADHYSFLFKWLCRRFDKRIWAERSGGSLVMMPAMHKAFPTAKFVHIFRDGRDVALSMSRHPPMRLLAANWKTSKRRGIDLLRPPFRLGDSKFIAALEPIAAPLINLDRQLSEDVPLEVLGEFWSELVTLGKHNMEYLPDSQRMDLKFEDLIREPTSQIKRLIRFLDPKFEDDIWLAEKVAQVERPRVTWRTLPAAQRDALTNACAPGLEILGYENGNSQR